MATKSKAGGSAKERVAAMRAAEKRRERVRWIITFAVVLVIVGALGGGAFWAINKDQKEQEARAAKANQARVEAGPPWALPADPVKRAKELGLDVKLGMEGQARHVHAHLSLFVNGEQVQIPANLGIDAAGNIAELHTHDTRGVLHVESFSPDKVFTLQQVFDIWEIPLSKTQIGQFKTDATHTLKFYVDGKEVTDDPSKITLEAHREIGIVFGDETANSKVEVPAKFEFEEGE
ncbi:hypothetical protein LO762_15450 [Actinocorallia sp. API 0066]|uniref:hypothetical protein n=1 Tax=Actinocorallia sp. API 0066 TaxID=2896846 RepID=UPI001E3E7948|nr:hypothetical protein [Actinocorallia sp. API 0066]MCD0450575.1 hypothetical protein [Actinocorallia sp. API 0066]